MSDKQTSDLFIRLRNHESRYSELLDELKECEYIINLTKNLIYNSCEHQWLIDHTNTDEHTMYICSKCNSIKN